MRLRGELRCLNCSRLLAEVEGGYPDFRPLLSLACPTGRICLTRKPSGALKCTYCGGEPMIEEQEEVLEPV